MVEGLDQLAAHAPVGRPATQEPTAKACCNDKSSGATRSATVATRQRLPQYQDTFEKVSEKFNPQESGTHLAHRHGNNPSKIVGFD